MDIFEEYLSPTALLDAFPSVPQFQTLEETSNHAFVFHEISPEAAGTRERIRQKWETLKPLIKRVYIDDNKPYPSIARILREEHQFETT
jgi:hypothetical protein